MAKHEKRRKRFTLTAKSRERLADLILDIIAAVIAAWILNRLGLE